MRHSAILLLVFLLAPAVHAGPDATRPVYASQVRPILARHCFRCHGPDADTRKARLRLDLRDEAMKPARSRKKAIVPGKPEASELMARILTTDETEVMPPPSTRDTLTAAEKGILRRWIADGAPYTPHWAFQPVRRHAPPSVKNSAWPRNPIDRFILARLEREGLAPSPEADRYTLARRVHLDLTGLPPTPEEADAFVADTRPGAYERMVERLLGSSAYGERWARRWLDLARYADTNGYEKDRPRSIWPYRDWVIEALNADMPYDRFTIEQIAGDMLPGATRSQRIATGFHRNTMLNEEGGIDPLEFRFHAMTDRVATTGTVWLGLTLGCAQCHSHKYDPISHKEYYQILAFLDNTEEPELEVLDTDSTDRRAAILEQIDELEAGLVDHFPYKKDSTRRYKAAPMLQSRTAAEKRFVAWLQEESARTVTWHPVRPVAARSNLPLLRVLDDDSVLVSGDQSKSDAYEVTLQPNREGVVALRLEALPDESLPKRGPGRVYYEGPFGDFFLSEVTVQADGRPVKLVSASHSHAFRTFTADRAIDGDPQTGWAINGRQGLASSAVFRLETPLGKVKQLKVRLLFERYHAAGLGRFRLSVTTDRRPAVARDLSPELEEALLLPPDRLTQSQREALFRQFLRVAPELAMARRPIDVLRQELFNVPTTLVMRERPADNPRPTFVYHRGEFLQPRERVSPAVPEVLHPYPKDQPASRLGFARWLVSPANPLVGRVTVNRHWAALFGRGIVATEGDFGLQGELPSHPELLDWLASEFVESGWSLKRLHRLLVTSATYRQASRVSKDLLVRDPQNRLLARGPRVRVEAEIIRDSVLRASGLLASKIGGPSVFPPQPAAVTVEGTYGAMVWKVSTGLDRYRRGLYTFSKRTAPFAFDGTFDGPSGEVCQARREVSNTPLQALTMLNDEIVLEAARALGDRMATAPGSTAERVTALFRQVLTRPPLAEEQKMLVRFLQLQHKRFIARELDPALLAGSGTGNVGERAAWTALARVLLNLDETITKR